MDFVYHCQTHKDSAAIVYMWMLCVNVREWESTCHYKQQDVTMQCPEWPSLSLSFGFKPTCEHLEALNLIKTSFFSSSCSRSPLEVAGRLD